MEKKYIDFVKSLEDSKIVKKGSHKNEQVMETIKEICEMSEKEAKNQTNSNIIMIYDEYTDWAETYMG